MNRTSNILRGLTTLLVVVVAAVTLTTVVGAESSSIVDLDHNIAMDESVRHGVLPNKLTYYIRHNTKPKGQADFYILTNVGAIQEDDDQQGLAHFLEHLAFNGTRNFKGKELIEYLESIGVKFGANLNAYTSWDNTVYMMKDLPTKRTTAVDSALLILHDWAGFIEPKKSEIDKERGVIKEELRTRDGAGWRSTMAMIKAIGRGTKYEHRNLIGYLDQLESFEADALIRFYHSWYRPDNQAIMIVGDVDVDAVEAKVKSLFADIPAPKADAPQKAVIRVPDNEQPIVDIFTDPEQQYSTISYYIKREAVDTADGASVETERQAILDFLIEIMQGSRFDEVSMSPNAPILSGGASFGRIGIIPTLAATAYSVQSPEGGLNGALRELVTQMERARRYGFKEGEFERAKVNLMRGAERAYANRDDRTNNSFIDRFISNYRFGTAVPSAEDEWQRDQMLMSTLTLDDVNARVKELFSDINHVVILNSPKKDGLSIPTEEEVLAIIEEVCSTDVEPYSDVVVGDSLLPEGAVLSGSKVVRERYNASYDATEWMLSNGVKVIVKPTKLKEDEVLIEGFSDGGLSLVGDDLYNAGAQLSSLVSYSGVGDYTAVELDRLMTGKLASLNCWVGGYSQGFSGGSSPSDVETMLQLLYLRFTSPRFAKDDLELYRRNMISRVENQITSPSYLHSKRFAEVVYGDNLRRRPIDLDLINALELSQFKVVHERMFSDADNFTVVIVGNVSLDELRPLVERYIGSLPTDSTNKKMDYADDGVRSAKGMQRVDFRVDMAQPKVGSWVFMSDNSIDYTLRNRVVAGFLKSALDDLLLKSVREDKGGTYGVSTSLSLVDTPRERYNFVIRYDTNEAQFEDLQKTVFDQLDVLAMCGATEEQMNKHRQYMQKTYKSTQEYNRGWMSWLSSYYDDGCDYLDGYLELLDEITAEDVSKMARRILKDKSRVEVIMFPESSNK